MPAELNEAGLLAFLAGLDEAIAEGVEVGTGYIVELGQQLAPVDEGDFRDSIKKEQGEAPGTWRALSDGDKAPHNIFVEFGDPSNPNYPAQPTLGPAADAIDVRLEVKIKIEELAKRSGL